MSLPEKKNVTSNNLIKNARGGVWATVAVTAGVALAPQLSPAQTAPSAPLAVSTLPGGASSLNETYKDWQVTCVSQGALKRCAISQTQTQQNGRRVLTVELTTSGNTVSGTLLLPFGLALDKGVTLQIDDKPANQPWRFRTCVPAGCVVALNFEAPTMAALRTGNALKLKTVADDGTDVPLSISLNGFGAAIDRAAALAK